jgi:formylglycine-generating enzyme required for sulfatase activity
MIENLTPIYEIGGKTDPKEWGIIPDQRNELWDAVIWNSNANGYRLPTEMEWIWAAMGADANNTKNDRFSGDNGKNNIEDYSWYRNNSAGTTHPVGIKLPNNLGIFDMSGNVWEWIWDWSTIAWPKGKLIDYHGTDSGIERKVRGGAWYNPDFCQSIGGISGASSGGMDPSIRTGNFVGFRIARSK